MTIPQGQNPYASPVPPASPQAPQAPQAPNPYAAGPGQAYPSVPPQGAYGPGPYGEPAPQQQGAYSPGPYGQAAPQVAPPHQGAYGPGPYAQAAPPVAPPQQGFHGQAAPPPPPAPYPPAYEQQPQWGPASEPGAALTCRFCGGYPAVQATVRGHQGMIVIMRWLSLRGPFCRFCGISAHRDMTTKTMWQGWWGYGSFLITPFVLLYNLIPRSRFHKLPAPQPGFRPPMDPGKPIYQRPGVIGLLVPLVPILLLFVSALAGASGS